MNWLKRNLMLVISGAVALVLLAFGGLFLLKKIEEKEAVNQRYDRQQNELKRLRSRRVFPSEENITAAQKESERLENFYERLTRHFPRPELPEPLDGRRFKSLLETTIYELNERAEQAAVTLPPGFDFTFGEQRRAVSFRPSELKILASQVLEIGGLMEVMYDAKVHAVLNLRRARVSEDESQYSSDITRRSIQTNSLTGAMVSPYEVTFQCFSSELADVMAGLSDSDLCFVVKSMKVVKGRPLSRTGLTNRIGTASSSLPQGMTPEMAERYGLAPPRNPGMDREMMERYGIAPGGSSPGDRYRSPEAGFPPGAPGNLGGPQGKGGLPTVLEEKPLRITIKLDLIKLMPSEEPPAGAPGEPGYPSEPGSRYGEPAPTSPGA